MKKKQVLFLKLAIALFLVFPSSAGASGTVSARSAILIEQHTGRVLYEKDAYTVRRIASITKIMTAILAVESGKMNERVVVSNRAAGTEGSSLYLKQGEKIKLSDLVYGLMLRSGNDAAVAIAEHVGGSLEGFVYMMNQKAEELGMDNTHFANPHGLDDHENHHSTAYDMAILTKYAMANETYRKISGTEVHRAPNPNEPWDRVWKNKNRLLTELYKNCTGGKTGYTKRAKRTLVTTASRGGFDLIAVTLDGPDDWNDHISMYERAISQYDIAGILKKGEIKGIEDPYYKGKVYLEKGYEYPLTADEEKKVRVEYRLLKPSKTTKENQIPRIAGKAFVFLGDKEITQLPVYSKQEPKKEESLLDYIRSFFFVTTGMYYDG
ncbi:D-alanyl-D-alanine carboxypeptidase family protein [Bacillus massilinigeriensis]|uniref:D-alanyl-D-alanine carboxypeptidase family protein n=1 Tax=Bacillus mediterraneensis TaxID=1805474 RepID=UPI0008F82218|nr:D-alanyl-D-alanine carboxypeptidase family protein [Bacillus mediterraneensis]